MSILHDPLDFPLPPPHRLLHFAGQDFLERWRIEKWEALNLPPTPEEVARAEARLVQMAERLERIARGCRRAGR